MSDVTGYLNLLAHALDVIGDLAGSATADKAADVVKVIRAIYETVRSTHAGKVTPEMAKDEIQRLTESLAANDDAALTALKKKFGRTD